MLVSSSVTQIIKNVVDVKVSGVEPCPPPLYRMASETSVTESETTVSDGDTSDQDGLSRSSNAFTGWFASSTLRIGLLLIGVFLLLAALGQLSGIDILGLTAELLGTSVDRWLLVGAVAIALIAIAVRGFSGRSD